MMENYKERLEEQLQQLNSLVKQSNKNLAKYKDLGSGQVHLSKCRGNYQYYFIDKEHGTRKYLKTDAEKLIKKYIQKDYENDLNKKSLVLIFRLKLSYHTKL